MKHRFLSVTLALCLFLSAQSMASAEQEVPFSQNEVSSSVEADSLPREDSLPPKESSMLQKESVPQEEDSALHKDSLPQEDTLSQEGLLTEESAAGQIPREAEAVPDLTQVYSSIMALQNQDEYKEGTTWTDYEPYSESLGYYHWNGGLIGGKRISAVGCVAFAFILSDAAFGSLPNRMYAAGEFAYEDIKAGDILRVNNDTHTVIVLEANDAGVIVAEGNISNGDHRGKVHWGRAISREEVMSSASHYITRYPEGYSPDDPSADESIAGDSLTTGLSWNLTKAGTLTISGSGAMPDFGTIEEQPWNSYGSQIRTVILEDGVTSIGSCAFWKCGLLGVKIPASVTAIGNNAFLESSIVSVTIPSGVKTVGDSAFSKCLNLSSVTISEGLETIGQNAFRSCAGLKSIAFPASIQEVGSAAFLQCQALTTAAFAPGNTTVRLGDNLFTGCYYLMGVTLPQSIDRIGEGMFQNCLLLNKVKIPQGAESIGASAFASSGLSVVEIPDSVTTIGNAALSNCPLTDIYFTGTEAQWNGIGKLGDTASAVSKATIHYGALPEPSASPEPTTSPEPSASPEPTTSPEPSASPEPTTSPEPSASPKPTATPPTQAPEQTASPEPTAAPGTASPAPTQAPAQTAEPSPTPTIPSIAGESGKEGWAAIKDEAANASEGNQISVNMNGASVVPGDVLDSIKGQNITISFNMGSGIVWTVNGKDVTAEHANDVNLSVQVGTSAIPQDIVDNVAGNRQTIELSLAHSGDFGYTAALTINVGEANAGTYANLFYYNESAGRLEFVTADQIKEDGTAKLLFTHASDYIIVVSSNMGGGNDTGNSSGGTASGGGQSSSDGNSPQKADTRSPKTGEIDSPAGGAAADPLQPERDQSDFMWLLLAAVAGLAASGAIACLIAATRTVSAGKPPMPPNDDANRQ